MNFTGREILIAALCTRLGDIAPNQWNHRVALFGLGGIGKTQLALEYVYTHRDNYEFVFWISAVSEATLLSSFQDIAKRTRCVPNTLSMPPPEIASAVLAWLNRQESWLLVIDNLDNIEVIDPYLPNVSIRKHTLITTRNQHCDDIPAEGLEVGALEIDEAVQLLLTRAKVERSTERQDEAVKIVTELGYLPLAIEQAAAFIREASKDIFTYLSNYLKNRKTHHARASKANRKYYNQSVATTWHMSISQIEKQNNDAIILLRLLAFLNPDGILTDFLDDWERRIIR